MGGMAGIWNRDGKPVQREPLRQMSACMVCRGPDGEGVVVHDNVGLAHRRLAISDPSSKAAQPMVSADGRFTLMFDGAIYNHPELRSELEAKGHCFRSSGDTEVVLNSFVQWGSSCFEKFNGMWAIAIWDRVERQLLLCRDRFGIKRLYVSIRGPRVAFASQIKAITLAFPEERQVNEVEVGYFLLGASPDRGGTETFFRKVQSVPCAAHLTVSSDRTGPAVHYWSMPTASTRAAGDAEEKLRFLLRDAVRLRTSSDVPVGACLSGGLDSSSIVRLAVEMSSKPLHCFSLRYDAHPHDDESDYARMAADDPARYILHWVTPRAEHLLETMAKIVWHSDSPGFDFSQVAAWSLYAEASKSVSVALSGEGADLLLASSTRSLLPYLLDRVSHEGWPTLVRPTAVIDLARLVGRTANTVPYGLFQLFRPFWRHIGFDPGRERAGIGDVSLLRGAPELPAHRFYGAWLRSDLERPLEGYLNNALWLDFRYLGFPETLHSEDAVAMAFSVEVRRPFLDHRMVEFCFHLPYRDKIRGAWTKNLLRRAMKGTVPDRILNRRDKKGLHTPMATWLREPAMAAAFHDLIVNGRLARSGIIRREAARRLVKRLTTRLRPLTPLALDAVWRCATLESWFCQFIADQH